MFSFEPLFSPDAPNHYTDAVFEVPAAATASRVFCHRCVLAASSPVLDAALRRHAAAPDGSLATLVPDPEVGVAALRVALEALYTGELAPGNALPLLGWWQVCVAAVTYQWPPSLLAAARKRFLAGLPVLARSE